jgi:hypothetical protein
MRLSFSASMVIVIDIGSTDYALIIFQAVVLATAMKGCRFNSSTNKHLHNVYSKKIFHAVYTTFFKRMYFMCMQYSEIYTPTNKYGCNCPLCSDVDGIVSIHNWQNKIPACPL